MALLGAIMRNSRALDRVADYLEPEHFADPGARLVYAAMKRRILNGGVLVRGRRTGRSVGRGVWRLRGTRWDLRGPVGLVMGRVRRWGYRPARVCLWLRSRVLWCQGGELWR